MWSTCQRVGALLSTCVHFLPEDVIASFSRRELKVWESSKLPRQTWPVGLRSDPRPALKQRVFAKATLEIFVMGKAANFGDKATLILVLTGWAVTWPAQGEYYEPPSLCFFYFKGLEPVPWPSRQRSCLVRTSMQRDEFVVCQKVASHDSSKSLTTWIPGAAVQW